MKGKSKSLKGKKQEEPFVFFEKRLLKEKGVIKN